LLEACPAPDILITNAGGPPPGVFKDFAREDWLRAVEANMLSPILLIQATLPGMLERGFGRIVNITSGAVKSPASYPQLGLSLAARGGLTAVMGALSRQTVGRNVTINNLLPGRFDTDRLHQTLDYDAQIRNVPKARISEELLESIPAGRFGQPAELGATCAFLCSAQAGFITGQNIILDGGAFPGLL
jgi:3-oxoacyl-[acyl-carrier protein] reductase